MVHESLVKVAPTEMSVVRSSLDIKLSLAELNDTAAVACVADIDKHYPPRLLLRRGKVKLGDTVAEGDGGGIVHEPEALESCNFRGIQHGSSLTVGEPRRHTDDDIGDGELQLFGGGELDLIQIHGNQLGSGELLLPAPIANFGAGLAVDVNQLAGIEFLFDLDLGILDRAAGKKLERAHGVFEVGDLLCLGGFADISALRAETDEGTVRNDGSVICHLDRIGIGSLLTEWIGWRPRS
jgi:hypothetical protein